LIKENIKVKTVIGMVAIASISLLCDSVLAADKAGFVSSKSLNKAGGHALYFKSPKPVLIKSVKSKELKAGQACDIHLDSVREAILVGVKNGTVVLPTASEKPKEAHISLHGEYVRDEDGKQVYECKGEGNTCAIVIVVPPDTVELVN
jgi:hypothetical protein